MLIHVCDHILERMIFSLAEEVKYRYTTSETTSGKVNLPVLVSAGISGDNIVERFSDIFRSQGIAADIRKVDVGEKGKDLKYSLPADLIDRPILICDSIVNTGSTLRNIRDAFLAQGAKDVKTLTVFLRNGAMIIPNFYLSSIDINDEVIFGIDRYPVNFYDKGNIKLLDVSDCGKKINCGSNYIYEYYDDFLYAQKTNDDCRTYVIQDANGPVGVLHFKLKGNNELFIDTIAVNSEKQGNNYGATLMSFLEDYCRLNKIIRVTLHAHESKVDFYKKFQYTETGTRYHLPAYGDFIEMEMKFLFNT